jgi:hypothetical protein
MAGARGESTLEANGREVRVLFTNRALADAEQKLGRSILAVVQGMTNGTTGLSETAQLLRVGMEAARRDAGEPGPAVALNTAFDVMDAAGYGQTAKVVMEAAAAVLSYGTSGTEASDPNAR